MTEIKFSPLQTPTPHHVLNHPEANPFTKNNISFHIDGQYLTDFSKDGIEKFVKKHGKDVSADDVTAFIQSVAQEPGKVANSVFTLDDPELGLLKDDGINGNHISSGFSITAESTSAITEISFLDVTAASFPGKELEDVQAKIAKVTGKQAEMVDELGNDAQGRLSALETQLADIEGDLGFINDDIAQYQERMDAADPASAEYRELKFVLRGASAEKKELLEAQKKAQAEMKDQGVFDLYNLSDLQGVNAQLAQLKQLEEDIKAKF